jgi:hypothetical protein
MSQTPEQLARSAAIKINLMEKMAEDTLPDRTLASEILSAIQSATQPLVRRVEELENSELQLVDQRDSAESALGDAYESVIGRAPEWSSAFGYTNAVDEIGESLAALTARVKELEEQLAFLSVCATENANLHTDKATLTAENAELRKLLRAVLDEHNKGMCEDSEFGNSNGPYMPPSITLRIRQAIDQARNQ